MESRTIQRDGSTLHGLWRVGHGNPLIIIPGQGHVAHVVDAGGLGRLIGELLPASANYLN